MNFRNTISHLVHELTSNVLFAIQTIPVEDLLSESRTLTFAAIPGPPRRRVRDVDDVVERIIDVLRGTENGMRLEALRSVLLLNRAELARPIREALSAKRILKAGQRRGTTYFAATPRLEASPARADASAATNVASEHPFHERHQTPIGEQDNRLLQGAILS